MATRLLRLPHIFDHIRLKLGTSDIVRRCLTTKVQDGGHQTGRRHNFETYRDGDAISTATLAFCNNLRLDTFDLTLLDHEH